MSRCLPFSAEAYAKRGLNQEALIKLHKEKDEKSERRKEKDLKRKSKKEHKHKEKKTSKVEAYDRTKKVSNEKDPQHKSKLYLDSRSPPQSLVCKSEQLEKSDITEEHDAPSCSGSNCNLLDSVDSNNKRKREEVTANTGTDKRRNVLRIRLPTKPDGPNALGIEQPKTCPSKGSETSFQERNEEHISHSKIETKTLVNEQLSLKPCPELPLSTSETKHSKSSKRSKASVSYKTLIVDWVPEVPSCTWLGPSEFDDEDWLFGSESRQHGLEMPKRLKSSDEVFCSRSGALCPQAMHLPEVDIFALPYTIPY